MQVRVYTVVAVSITTFACQQPAATAPARPSAAPPAAVTIPATPQELDAAQASGKLELYEAGLRQQSQSADPAVRGRALATLGLWYEQQERYAEAAESLRAASNDLPDIAPYLAVHAVDDLARAEKYGEAISLANQLLTIAPGTPAATEIALTLPALYARSGDLERAAAALAKSTSIPVDEYSEVRMVQTADALQAVGQNALATGIRSRLLFTYPRGRYTEKLYDQLLAASPSPIAELDFAKSVDLADQLARVNRYDQVLDLLKRIEQRFPEESKGAQYRYVKLRALFNSRNYADATALVFARGDANYLGAELLRGRAFWRNDQNGEFVKIMERIIAEAPTSKEATEAKVQLGKYYVTDETNYDKATSYLDAAIKAGAGGEQGDTLWALGWTYVVAKRYDEALRTFDRYLAAYPDADYTSNALFWTGLVQQRLGRNDQRDRALRKLIAQYPYAYYSYRAREILGEAVTPPSSIVGAPSFPDLNAPLPAGAEARLASVKTLLEIGLRPEAARELKGVTALAPNDQALAFRMAELYSDARQPLKAMAILQSRFRSPLRNGASNVPPRFWEMLYPRPYWDEIVAAGKRMNLDPYIIAAITRQESAFDPTVVSNAGAAGLMQIMPNELSRITADAGLEPGTRSDLFDPKRNTEIGAAEFTQKLARMQGNRTLAIAAYNAGEVAVGRWLATTPIEDLDFFIESISYNETRLYVKNVTRNLYEYRRIYEPAIGGAAPTQ